MRVKFIRRHASKPVQAATYVYEAGYVANLPRRLALKAIARGDAVACDRFGKIVNGEDQGESHADTVHKTPHAEADANDRPRL